MNRVTKNFLFYLSGFIFITSLPLCIALLLTSSAFRSGNCSWLPGCEDRREHLEKVFYWTSFSFAVAMNVGLAGISFLPDPEHAKDFNFRGKRCQSKGKYIDAIAHYNTAIQIKPSVAEFYNNRGSVYYICGDTQSAIADFDKAIELDPKFARAYLNRGIIYKDMGKKEAAYSCFKKAKALYSSPIKLSNPERGTGYELAEYLIFCLSLGQDPLGQAGVSPYVTHLFDVVGDRED